MKWAPTLLVLAAFGVLLWVSTKKPGDAPAGKAGNETNVARQEQSPAVEPAVEVVKPPSAASAAPPPARTPDTIAALVKDPSGHGVAQIEVTLFGPDGSKRSTRRTGADGRVTFDVVPAGACALETFDPDYLYTASSRTTVSARKGETTEVELAVARGTAGVLGAIVDGGGKPVVDQSVTLTAGGAEFSVRSDAKGRFRVSGLVAGEWRVTPERFADQSKTVRLEPATAASVSFTLPQPATLDATLSGSHLHHAEFHGGEKALLRATGTSDAKPLEQTLVVVRKEGEGPFVAAETFGTARFTGLAPGDYKLDFVDARESRSLISAGGPWSQPIPVTLREGDIRPVDAKTEAALHGTGAVVGTGIRVAMFVVIGLLVLVTPILFPAPLVPKRPAGAASKQ